MLRPERMSRVSVSGARPVMDAVVETVHDLQLVHVSDYDGSWEGFKPGDPTEGADEVADRLVTVRALESTLDLEGEDAGAVREVDDEELAARLEAVRGEVNELDDRRSDMESELRSVEERIDTFEPFAALGIDLDLLSGYDSLAIAVGEGDPESVETTLARSEDVDAFEVFAEGEAVAAFVHPAASADEDFAVADALVGVPFQEYAVPDAEGRPGAYLADIESRRDELASQLDTVEEELGDVRLEVGEFLLAAEEQLTIQLEKQEAPLQFATTKNAFVAEGWVPTDRVGDLRGALTRAVDDRVEVEELERAAFDGDTEIVAETPSSASPAPAASGPSATDADAVGEAAEAGGDAEVGEEETVADGGVVTMGEDDPPVKQHNPRGVRPFELLTQAVGRPNYTELDPTIVLFLTFPLMFGFMIGDIGYGIIYTAIGYAMYARTDSTSFQRFGIVAAAAGIMTIFFGILYGEIFGLHLVTEYLWVGLAGLEHAPIEKGLSPAGVEWAEAWFVVTAIFGLVHLDIGYVFEFVENNALHGFKEATVETGSWLLALNGLWLFVFTRPPTVTEAGETVFVGPKPPLLYRVFDTGPEAAVDLGFSGIPGLFTVGVPLVGSVPVIELVGVAMILAGAVLLVAGPTHELIEFHQILAHTLSYLRIGAVLLAKAGMAFAVNLLFFGVYETHGEWHFMLTHGPEYALEHYPEAEILFPGMLHGGALLAAFGVVVLVVGHLVVLLLGVTSAGIQSIRLEYFEFFSKFYEGGGTVYTPFGREREYTEES